MIMYVITMMLDLWPCVVSNSDVFPSRNSGTFYSFCTLIEPQSQRNNSNQSNQKNHFDHIGGSEHQVQGNIIYHRGDIHHHYHNGDIHHHHHYNVQKHLNSEQSLQDLIESIQESVKDNGSIHLHIEIHN